MTAAIRTHGLCRDYGPVRAVTDLIGNSQLSRGVSAGDYAVMVAVGLCALAAAMLAFRRLDIH